MVWHFCVFLCIKGRRSLTATAFFGALDAGSQMSHVNFKKWQCPLSLFLQYLKWFVACRIYGKVPVMSVIFFLLLVSSMSHVDFKKWPCHHVDYKGQGPLSDVNVSFPIKPHSVLGDPK